MIKLPISVLFLAALLTCPAFSQNPPGKGRLRVTVQLLQQAPPLPEVVVDKNIPFCGAMLLAPVLLVRNAVISIDWQGQTFDREPPAEIALKGEHCLMQPRVQAARSGAILLLNSGDDITHNPHGWINDERTVFNITILDASHSFRRKLQSAGKYRIDCDTHAWMRAYIWVFDHPYYAITGTEGQGLIRDLPVGTYGVRVWHEVLGERRGQVSIYPDQEAAFQVSFELADHREDRLKPKTKTPWPN